MAEEGDCSPRVRFVDTNGLVYSIPAGHRFFYRGGAILAAAQAPGCDEILTEDLSHGRVADGMLITNPFL